MVAAAKGRLSASETQLEYEKLNRGEISLVSKYVPPKEKKTEHDSISKGFLRIVMLITIPSMC